MYQRGVGVLRNWILFQGSNGREFEFEVMACLCRGAGVMIQMTKVISNVYTFLKGTLNMLEALLFL